MPLVQFVVSAGMVDIFEHRIVHLNGALLVVAAGKKLDHLPPETLLLRCDVLSFCLRQAGALLLFGSRKVKAAVMVQNCDHSFQAGDGIRIRFCTVRGRKKVFMAEIIQYKFLGMDLVHGGARVGNGSTL